MPLLLSSFFFFFFFLLLLLLLLQFLKRFSYFPSAVVGKSLDDLQANEALKSSGNDSTANSNNGETSWFASLWGASNTTDATGTAEKSPEQTNVNWCEIFHFISFFLYKAL
jgi:hypothetical protein